jgi:hypothetical protein
VDDSLLVRRREAVRDLDSILDGFALGHRTAVEHRAQSFALQQLGDQKRRAVMLPDVEHGQNVGMIQRRYRARLLLKATQAIAFAGKRLGKNFEGDITAQTRIFCAIHFSHAARAKRTEDFVGTEFRTGGERHPFASLYMRGETGAEAAPQFVDGVR